MKSKAPVTDQATVLNSLPRGSGFRYHPLDLDEFKMVACSSTGALLFIEVQRGKEGINHRKYHHDLGATTAFTKRII